MKSICDLKNRDEVIKDLVKLLKTYDITRNTYQTDVYLYIDDHGIGTLDEFVNVGGNSWLDDDHIVLYSDPEHYDTIIDEYTSIENICNAMDLDESKIRLEIDPEEPDSVDYWSFSRYVLENYYDAFLEVYLSDRDVSWFYEAAEKAIAYLEEEEAREENY